MLLPDSIEEIDYATLKAETLAHLSGFLEVAFLESDSVMLVVEAMLYREMLLRARINESLRASYLFTATGTNLDAVAYGYGAVRLEGEEDAPLRERCLLGFGRFSTAGAVQTYIYWAKSVHADIKEVQVLTPSAGVVEIVYLSATDRSGAILLACSSDAVRPLTDHVVVSRATIKAVSLSLGVEIQAGYDIVTTRARIVEAFASLALGVGDDLPLSKIYDTAHVEGVYKVTCTETADIIANEREVIQPMVIFN